MYGVSVPSVNIDDDSNYHVNNKSMTTTTLVLNDEWCCLVADYSTALPDDIISV